MFKNLFDKRTSLDDVQSRWLLDAFEWSLDNFDSALFFRDARLVLPTNEFFPGRADSVEGVTDLILRRVKTYAGMSHWPTRLMDQSVCAPLGRVQVTLDEPLRRAGEALDTQSDPGSALLIPYNSQQINKPEGMIASFAHVLAHYLGQTAKEPPPGGIEYWPHATELVAIYLGFGLMFANSAFNHRGGCGSCYNPRANRDAYLSELEATYALAIFCVLKEIQPRFVIRHLKSHLKGVFKNMTRDAAERIDPLHRFKPVVA